jgi:hypothetical protein
MKPLEADAIVACLNRHGTVRVAALTDIIRSKEAAGRPKDQAALPILRQLLEEIRKKG